MQSIRQFLQRHPLLRDALIWAIPALIVGAVLRWMLVSYSPYAYWGSDSRSYFGFSHNILTEGYVSLYAKRRYVYPIFLLPIAPLPGGVLRWLAWIQPAIGLITLIPLAYVIRKLFVAWRIYIIPITVVFAGMPIYLWYEHELLAECLFFSGIVWSLAGWVAWASEKNVARGRQLWWWFFVPFALTLLTKPAGRFLLPGICLGLVVAGAWRTLRWRELIAGIALIALTLTAGDKNQGPWLLYTSAFPLTRLDTPLHAEYKAEIRDMVEEKRLNIDTYAKTDGEIFYFLRDPKKQDERPLWKALGKDQKALTRVYKDLALEGIKSDPQLFAYIGLQKLVGSANLRGFNEDRFEADYSPERLRKQYEGKRTSDSMLRMAFDLPDNMPLPPYEEFKRRLSPNPNGFAATWLPKYVDGYLNGPQLVNDGDKEFPTLSDVSPTPLGWWILLGAVLSLIGCHTRTIGVWTITIALYLMAVFLVGIESTRYFAPAWPLLFLLLPIPIDAAIRSIQALRHRGSVRSPGNPTAERTPVEMTGRVEA